MNYSEVEARVREATNDDAWGPHGTIMHEISQYTFTYEHFPEVMSMLWKRMLHENKKNWRRVYKVMWLTRVCMCVTSFSILNDHFLLNRFCFVALIFMVKSFFQRTSLTSFHEIDHSFNRPSCHAVL